VDTRPSYHDVFVTTREIPRTSVFDLPYGYELSCTRVGGWQLIRHPDSGPAAVVAEEYSSHHWLVIDVAGHTVLDSRPS
jgi:hypothetical protein